MAVLVRSDCNNRLICEASNAFWGVQVYKVSRSQSFVWLSTIQVVILMATMFDRRDCLRRDELPDFVAFAIFLEWSPALRMITSSNTWKAQLPFEMIYLAEYEFSLKRNHHNMNENSSPVRRMNGLKILNLRAKTISDLQKYPYFLFMIYLYIAA